MGLFLQNTRPSTYGRITVTTNNIRFLSMEAVKNALWGHPPHRQSLPVSETIVVRPVDITWEAEVCNLHTQLAINPELWDTITKVKCSQQTKFPSGVQLLLHTLNSSHITWHSHAVPSSEVSMDKLALSKVGHTKSNISAHTKQHCFRESLKWILIHRSMISNMVTLLLALSLNEVTLSQSKAIYVAQCWLVASNHFWRFFSNHFTT